MTNKIDSTGAYSVSHSQTPINDLIEKYDDLFNEAWDRWETTQCAIAQAEANVYDLILQDLEKL